jgi:hypothetical protein
VRCRTRHCFEARANGALAPSVVMGINDRRHRPVVAPRGGWALAEHMRTELVADALGMALRSRGPAEGADLPLGPGMSARVQRVDYGELARLNAVVLSIGRKGECWDNALADLLRHHQARAHRHRRMAPPAQLAQLLQLGRVGSHLPKCRPPGGMIKHNQPVRRTESRPLPWAHPLSRAPPPNL